MACTDVICQARICCILTYCASISLNSAMKKYKPTDATTNPSLIFAASNMPAYQSLIDDAVTWAKEQGGSVLYGVVCYVH